LVSQTFYQSLVLSYLYFQILKLLEFDLIRLRLPHFDVFSPPPGHAQRKGPPNSAVRQCPAFRCGEFPLTKALIRVTDKNELRMQLRPPRKATRTASFSNGGQLHKSFIIAICGLRGKGERKGNRKMRNAADTINAHRFTISDLVQLCSCHPVAPLAPRQPT